MKTLVVLSALAIALPAVGRDVIIDVNEIPLQVGTYARYRQNQSVFRWTPFDSTRRHWDVTGYPGQLTARVGLRPFTEGRFPAPDSMRADWPDPQVCEVDTLGSNSVQHVYLYADSFALWCDGIDLDQSTFRFLGNYRPDGEIYNVPLFFPNAWNTAWQWQYELFPGVTYVATEQHQKRVCAKGKIKVPISGEYYWPCLVIKDYMTFSDNMGSNETRWIYEWVVPGVFAGANGVCAAMSQNGAPPNFLNVDVFMQLASETIPGWDIRPPQFANTTVWPDTNFAGPFLVSSRITDNIAVGEESLFFRLNQGSWNSTPADSSSGDVYYFTIPPVAQNTRIDYYIWARDSFCTARDIELWTTWPVCSPESTMLTFRVTGTAVEHERPLAPGEARVHVMPNPVGSRARFQLSHPYARAARLIILRPDGTSVAALDLVADSPGILVADWNTRALPAGAYFYRITAPGGFTDSGKLLLTR
uniref:T9SS type A sorting domain-containing protein n=1 Tax=candidate division WOR-3 bacterium TaxID=2052148 RepID=A0A7C4CB54_UNCW3